VERADTLNRSFNPEQKGRPMAQIGTFKRTKAGISGRTRTLALDAELILVPVDKQMRRTRRTTASISAMTMAPRSARRLERVGNAPGRRPVTTFRCTLTAPP
jgi:hypothetical protein